MPIFLAGRIRPLLWRSAPLAAALLTACAPPAPKAAPTGPSAGETELSHLRAETVRLEERLRLALEERDAARAAAGRCVEAPAAAAVAAATPEPQAPVSDRNGADDAVAPGPEEPRLVLRAEGDDIGEITTAEPEAVATPGAKPAPGAASPAARSANPKAKGSAPRTSP